MNICKLNNIEKFDIQNNKIVELPKDIGNLNKLKYLLLNTNDLKVSPKSIKNLKNLIAIEIKNNNLEEILDFLHELQLSYLDFSGNPIKEFPSKIGNANHLGKGVY